MTFAGAQFRSFLPVAAFSSVADYLLELSGIVIAGHILGASALSSLNLIQPVFNVVIFLSMMIGTGTSVLFATEIGRFHERRAHEIFTQGFLSVIGFGSLLAIGLFLSADVALSAFGATPEIQSGARSYWLWYAPCALLNPLARFFSVMSYADGDRRGYVMGVGGKIIGTIVSSILLAYVYGLEGCAIGRGVGNALAILLLLRHFFRPGNNLRFVRHFSLRDSGRICWCSFGDAVTDLCDAALIALLNAYVIAQFGTTRLPILAVVIAVLGLAGVFDCIALAAQPLVGIYIGERNVVRTRSVMSWALKISIFGGLLTTAVLVLAPSLMVSLVGLNDPTLVPAAKVAIRWVSIGLTATAIMALFNSYYVFVERVLLAAVVTISAAFVMPAVLVPILGGFWGEIGAWVSLGVAPFTVLVVLSLFIIVRWGWKNFPYFLDRTSEGALRVFDLVLGENEICCTSTDVEEHLRRKGVAANRAARAALLVEETLMVVRDRNANRRVRAEVTVDLNEDPFSLILRDDGEIFDITDADQRISSLRCYLVSNLMVNIPNRRNLTTTGFNRNAFRL